MFSILSYYSTNENFNYAKNVFSFALLDIAYDSVIALESLVRNFKAPKFKILAL